MANRLIARPESTSVAAAIFQDWRGSPRRRMDVSIATIGMRIVKEAIVERGSSVVR